MLPVKKTMTETTVITLKNNLSLIYFWSDFFSDSRHLNLLLHLTLRTGKALEAGKHTNPSLHRVLGTPRFVILNPPKMWDLWIGSLPELKRELWCVDGNEAAASGEDKKLFEEAQVDLSSPEMGLVLNIENQDQETWWIRGASGWGSISTRGSCRRWWCRRSTGGSGTANGSSKEPSLHFPTPLSFVFLLSSFSYLSSSVQMSCSLEHL